MSKIVALIAFRNEELFLPGCLHHLRDFVDEIICLDDCSTDRSPDIAGAEQKVIKVLQSGLHGKPHQNEVRNRKALIYHAFKRGATYVICCDADERFETAFLMDLRNIAEQPMTLTVVRVRDLWNDPMHYRIDGHWGGKAKVVGFQLKGCPTCGPGWPLGLLHTPWNPPQYQGWPKSELKFHLYHLRSIHPEDRAARVSKFKAIDPDGNNDGFSYDYLNNDTGLVLEAIPEGKEYAL